MGGNSHKLERARFLQGVGELVALQVTSNVPQFFLYLKKHFLNSHNYSAYISRQSKYRLLNYSRTCF